MGRAERRAGLEIPPCPKCGPTQAAELASDGEYSRYQCGKCLDTYRVPRSSSRQVELDAGEDVAVHEAKEQEIPAERHGGSGSDSGKKEGDLMATCWCGRNEGHSGKHRGKGGKAKTPRAPKAAPTAARKSGVAGVLEIALEELKTKRAEILSRIPELQEVDRAILALEALSAHPIAGK